MEFETLEDRCVPSTASGVISGVAFVDALGKGSFTSTDATLPGINLTLAGKTDFQQIPVSVTTTTDANGAYTFANVLPGTYGISGTGGSVILGANSVSGLVVSGGQTLTENLSFLGLAPGVINMRMFLASTTSLEIPFAPPGPGQSNVNYRPNNAPTLPTPIADLNLGKNASATIDLAGHFSDPDITNSTVRIDTNNGSMLVKLFDTTAPQTVANFLNYVETGAYNNSFFHRLVSGFVLQGGGFTFNATTSTVSTIHANPAIANEFGASNTQFTLAMAQLGGDPNSATDEFFFNLVNNSNSLDPQKFAVFGQLVGASDQSVLNTLAATQTKDESNFNGAFGTLPLNNYNGSSFPTDATANNFLLIKDVAIVSQDEFLTYKVVGNTNSSVVTAAIDPNDNANLDLNAVGNQTGSAVITVQATDRYGVTKTDSFTVNVNEQAPTATVAISPLQPLATDTITANATASDPDGDPVTLTYEWQINGTTVQGPTSTSNLSDTLNLNGIAKPGDIVSVNVTPTDGLPNGTGTVATNAVHVVSPSAGALSFSPANPTSSDTLSATLNGTNAHSFTYEWSVNSNVVQTDTISATTDTLNQALNSGDQITLLVTPSDGTNTGTQVTGSVTVA